MNAREGSLSALHFRKPDPIPLVEVEAFEAETIQRWRGECLPLGMDMQEYLALTESRLCPWTFIQFQGLCLTLEENERDRVERNSIGITLKISKQRPKMLYTYLDHLVKTRTDWEKMKERLDPYDSQ